MTEREATAKRLAESDARALVKVYCDEGEAGVRSMLKGMAEDRLAAVGELLLLLAGHEASAAGRDAPPDGTNHPARHRREMAELLLRLAGLVARRG
jgi:hypothetical protein